MASSSSPATSRSAGRIIVVDDDRDSAFAISIMLKEQGYSVDWFTDPESVLSSFKKSTYDLIILDAKMPKIDGFTLYESISKIDPNVRVCFLTASYERGYEDLCTRLPNIAGRCYIRKPVTVNKLAETIKLLLSS